MQKVTPFLWFDDKAEEAANFYVSLFENSKITNVTRYGEGAPLPKGTVMTISFQLDGCDFIALNGGPVFTFNEAVSMSIDCKDQAEVDRLWDALLANGGKPGQGGWLKDRFGLSWQVVPSGLGKVLGNPDPKKAAAATQAMLKMSKLDLAAMQKAADEA